ncbi:NusG domain II-containing protein [Mogibacterium neglectum]|uniref:NusG domain II-containing protein n=1 Tax=Mogibacterium neglectum TaxID=114528 RepID=UPI00272B1903|nr:NusG domain II-containing protein [Mogibacterium neglectum]WLD76108.1 NusG domain II-containing protein [Mogibacterium neglectum]
MLKGFIRKADIVLFIILVSLGIASSVWLSMTSHSGDKVTVTVDGKKYGVYSLSEDKTIAVKQGNKLNVIRIKHGYVTMSEASCQNQVCVKHKAISKTGESIICLPNKVVVSIGGKEANKYDSVSS